MEIFNEAFDELNEVFDENDNTVYGEFYYTEGEDGDTLCISFPEQRYEDEHAAVMAERVELLRTHLAHLPRTIDRLRLVPFNGEDDGAILPPRLIRNEVLRILTDAMRKGMSFRFIQTSLMYEYDFDVATFGEFMAAAAASGVERFLAYGTLRLEEGTDVDRARAGVLAVVSVAREFMVDLDMNPGTPGVERGDLWREAIASNPRLETLAFGGGLTDSAIYQEIMEAAGMSRTLRNLHLRDSTLAISRELVEPLRTALTTNPLLRSVMLEGILGNELEDGNWFVGEESSAYNRARALVDDFHGLSLLLMDDKTTLTSWEGAQFGGVDTKSSPVSVALETALTPVAVAATARPCVLTTTAWALSSISNTLCASLPGILLPPEFPTHSMFDDTT